MTATVALLLRSGGSSGTTALVIWLIRATMYLSVQNPRPCPESARRRNHARRRTCADGGFLLRAFCYLRFGGVTVLQTFRQTTRKPVTLRARAPAELATALKSLAVKRDVVLSHVVREALATGAAIMLEAEDKTEVPA